MDSDENDYHGQGLHLVGEENSKVSPGLCPYALPKFDFDEGNLRFDSLVENEVFLGIQSQDDNQWIEDFSRGGSGIDFSSSAADSCSIPRHTNVWSEATSSESVEMLLKSVGQEDMVLEESVIRNSNTTNELPNSNQMDTNLMDDSKIGDFKEPSCGTPTAQFQQDFSPLKKVEPENISSSIGYAQPVDVCAGGFGERITSIVGTEQNLDLKGGDESKGCNLIGESSIDKIQVDDIISSLSSDSITGSGIQCVQNKLLDFSSENFGLPVEINIVGSHGASNISFVLGDVQVVKNSSEMHTSVHSVVCVAPETEVLSENAVKTTTNIEQSHMLSHSETVVLSEDAVQTTSNIEQSPMVLPQGNAGLPTEAGCKLEVVSPELPKASSAALTEGTGNELQSESNDLCGKKPCAVIKVDDGCSREQSSVVTDFGNDCGNEQSVAVSNNDQGIISHEVKKEPVVPKVMSGRGMDGDDAVAISGDSSKHVDHVELAEINILGVHGASSSRYMLNDGQTTEIPTQTHSNVPLSATYVAPGTESLSENKDKTTVNIEQSPMLPSQDNSTLLSEEGCKSELFSPELAMVSVEGYAAVTVGNDNELQSESKDPCGEKSCAVFIVDDGCSMEQSSVGSEISTVCGDEPFFAAKNNDKLVIFPKVEKQSAVPKVASGSTTDGDDDAFISRNSSKYVDQAEPAEAEIAEAEPAEAEIAETLLEPYDGLSSIVKQKRNDGNLTSDLVNKNSETHDAYIISADSIQLTEENSSPKPSTGMPSEQDSRDGNPLNLTRQKNDKTSESGVASSERDKDSFSIGDITRSVDHLESTEAISSPKLITGISAEPDSDNKGDKEGIATIEARMEYIDEQMKQRSGAIVIASAPAFCTAETEAKDANQSKTMVELHGVQINADQIMTEVGQETCAAESLHTNPVVRARDGAESMDPMNLKEGVIKGSINSIVEHCISSAPVVSASEISNNEGKEQSCMAESKDKDFPPSSDPNVVVANVSSTIAREGTKVIFEKESSEGAAGTLEEGKAVTFHAGVMPVLSGKETSPVEGSHSTYKPGQTNSKVAQGTSYESPQIHDQKASSTGPKSASERKTRRASGGKLAKGSPAKGNSSKEAESKIPRDVGNNSCGVLSPSASLKPKPLEAGSSAPKPTTVVAHSSNRPDLNTSTSTAVLFRQPFTYLQQLQLRAQIIVYGSLIQGAAPDESHMVSAFGTSDGWRSIWEPAWQAYIQRLQKTHLSNPETPMQSRSDVKSSGQAKTKGLSQRKARTSSNGNSSSVVNPVVPLLSPLWNISTPSSDSFPTNTVARNPVIDYQTLPLIHGYQTPTSRNYSGHMRVSQAPFPVPWLASPQASPNAVNAHIVPPQPTDIVKLTTVKASATPSPATMHASPFSVGQNGPSAVVSGPSAVVCGPSALQESKKVAESYALHSVDSKSRKRKKVSASEGLTQIAIPASLGRTESLSVAVTHAPPVSRSPALQDLGPSSLPPGVQVENADSFSANSQFLPSVASTIPCRPGLKSSTEKAVAVVSLVSSVDHPASSHQITGKRALSLDEVAKVEEAKLQAEQASAHASAAVSHCQNVCLHLRQQNSSNLMSDSEAKLASAAVCIAAAASVAKAASAAAKVASNVALQAKLMADEALISNRCLDSDQNISGFTNDTGSATPASILKVGDGSNASSSIIYAAREAARKRVEAASAASKHAENLDAIIKAAELAAEAVAQAGKIVALCDPLPLSKLVEDGPAGYWKDPGTPFGEGTKSNIVTRNNELTNIEEHSNPTVEQSERPLDSMSRVPVNNVTPDAVENSKHLIEVQVEKSKDLIEDQVKEKTATSAATHVGALEGQKYLSVSKMTKTVDAVPESESSLRYTTNENMSGIINDSRISVSSLVEVFKNNGDFTGAWFSASVLSLKNEKALVSYKYLETDEGKLTEWVPLEAGICKTPVIRIAHPMTSLTFDGTKKRRREVVKDYNWSVGDRVDAWLENCWSEGVIVEKNKKDDITLSVHFPDQGKTVLVKAWHLRRSLIWTAGMWIESPNSENDKSSQGDTPKEKRIKLGSSIIDDGKGKATITKITDPPESRKFEESRLLPLSAKEKSFHIGSSKTNKPEMNRTMRSGLQKEGPKVVFGVPKPGKKRKLMELSKHYKDNTDKEKSGKYVVPEGGGFGWKNSSKIDLKEKQGAEPRTRSFKPTKLPSSFTRTLPQKDKSVIIPSASRAKEGFSSDNIRTINATSNDDDSGNHHLSDFEDPISSTTSRAPLQRGHRKMTAASIAKSERMMKGKVAAATSFGKSNKVVEKEKSVPDVSEPRRSNRKIQPTSRLLEGLQSSLIMSKAPLVSHDKSNKGQKVGATRGLRS